jgi:hypothetical protein
MDDMERHPSFSSAHGLVRRRLLRLLHGVTVGVVAGLGLATAVASPVLADPPGPTDYRSDIRSVEPETPEIEVGIIGGDSFVELRVEPGTEAMVVGYEGEDYLWFRTDGVVLENRNSPATYLNADRYGIDGVPPGASADAEPSWQRVATGGYWAWHDHRAHWMQSARPFGLGAGDQILEAVIPIVVDGDTVEVTVISTWQPAPSPLAMWLGVVAGLGAAVGAWFSRGSRFPPVAASVPLVLLAVVVGVVQYASLPSATDPRPIWFVLPLIAAVSAAVGVVLALRGMRFAADAALLLVGAELAVWGFVKRDGLSAAIVPTDAPFWLDRFATAAALVGGVAFAGLALWWLFAVPAQRAAADGELDAVIDSTELSDSPHPAHP